ncbi:MAG: hypothetical protein K2Q18_17200 [Bdellovibrionales bacterium]|nr:hypothetical protein [Bdellovibrionales bacterium]
MKASLLFKILAMVPAICLAGVTDSFETTIPVDHIYSPAGFDSNDNTEIIVTGVLPDLCYKAPKSTAVLENGKVKVSVKALRKNNGMAFCTVIRLPYTEVVSIGVLDKGKYDVSVNENTSLAITGKLAVTEASSNSIDDTIYANVEEVTRMDNDKRTVLLKGYSPSDCFELKEIEVRDNGLDTYSILPKLKKVREFCPKKMIPFTYEFEVPEKLNADKVLLHVRVMDGRSINTFFNNKPLFE